MTQPEVEENCSNQILAAGPVLYFSPTLLHGNACAYLMNWALMSYNPKMTIHEQRRLIVESLTQVV